MKTTNDIPPFDSAAVHRTETVKVAKGATIILFGKIVNGAVKYLYLVIAANILGTKYFGAFMLGITIIHLVRVIASLGLDNGAIRFVSLYQGIGDIGRIKGTINQSLICSFLLSVLMATVLYIWGGSLLAELFAKPELTLILKTLVLALPFLSLMVMALAATQGFQVMKYTVYAQDLFWPIADILLVLLLAGVGFGFKSVATAYVISTFLAAGMALYFLRAIYPRAKHIKPVAETKKLFRFSIPLIFSILLSFLIMWTDTLMLGKFRSSEEVGIYNAAMRTAMLTSMVLISFNTIFAPIISNLNNLKNRETLESLHKIITKWINMISIAAFLAIILFSKEILTLFGKDFIRGQVPLIMLAASQLVNAGVGSSGVMLAMIGKQDLVMYIISFVCALNIILNYLFIPNYGIVGASGATGISVTLMSMLCLIFVYRILRIHPYSLQFIKIIGLSVVCFVVVMIAKSILSDLSHVKMLLILGPVFAGTYAGLLLKWGITEEDKQVLRAIRDRQYRNS